MNVTKAFICFFFLQGSKLICFPSTPEPEHPVETASVSIRLIDTTNSCDQADGETCQIPLTQRESANKAVPQFQLASTSSDPTAPEHILITLPVYVDESAAACSDGTRRGFPTIVNISDGTYVSVNPGSALEVGEPNKNNNHLSADSESENHNASSSAACQLRFTRETAASSVRLEETTNRCNLFQYLQIASTSRNASAPESVLITPQASTHEATAACPGGTVGILPSIDRDSDASSVESEEVLKEVDPNKRNNPQPAKPKHTNESSPVIATRAVSQNECDVFTPKVLEQLLRVSEGGKEILQYGATGELSDDKQQELCTIIAKHHLSTRSKLLTDDLRKYTLAVTSLFKFEREVCFYSH